MGGAVVNIVSLLEDRGHAVSRAAGALRAGELVVFPTDTVYGLAVDAFNRVGTARVFEVKQRPRALPLPVVVSRPRQAWALCADVPPAAMELAAAFWPGALTMVLRQTPDLEWDLGQTDGTIALRMPGHIDLISLLEIVGPVAMTSANISTEPTPRDVADIAARLGDAVGVYVDGGPSESDAGSTIVDLTKPAPVLIREGPISVAKLEEALGAPILRA